MCEIRKPQKYFIEGLDENDPAPPDEPDDFDDFGLLNFNLAEAEEE